MAYRPSHAALGQSFASCCGGLFAMAEQFAGPDHLSAR